MLRWTVVLVTAAAVAVTFFSAEGAVFVQQAFISLRRNEKRLTTRNQIKLFDFNLFNSVLFIDQKKRLHARAFDCSAAMWRNNNNENKWAYGTISIYTRYISHWERKNTWQFFFSVILTELLLRYIDVTLLLSKLSIDVKIRIRVTFTNSIELSANSNYAFNLFNDFYL